MRLWAEAPAANIMAMSARRIAPLCAMGRCAIIEGMPVSADVLHSHLDDTAWAEKGC
jgi:hypothetical protein